MAIADPDMTAPAAHHRRFHVAARVWWPYLALLVLATLLIVVERFPLSRLDVPFTTHGDSIDKLAQIKTVAETGWMFHNDRLGYPFGYDRLDFPRFDSLNYVILGPLAALAGDPGVAMNLYFLASFPLIAFAMFWCLRRLGIDTGPALLAASIYAFLPYHVLRGVPHLTNGAYFLVPFAMLVLIRLAQDRLGFDTPNARKALGLALVAAVLVPLQMPYNGFFFAFLCVCSAFIAVAQTMAWRPALAAAVLLAATGGTFVAEQLPVMWHAHEHGATLSAERPALDAETYSLRLNEVVLPTTVDRRQRIALSMQRFDQAMEVPFAENRNQYVGAFGVLGFGALIWALSRAVRRRESNDAEPSGELEATMRIAALLAIAILLLAISTGFGTLIAFWITAKIRAYNRILPFLAFTGLLGGAWVLQSALRRVRSAPLRWAIFGAVFVLALFDVLVRPHYQGRADDISKWDADRAYFRSVEQQVGQSAAIFQLPVVWYPEHPPVEGMIDYDEFKPYLMTDTLRISYGGGQGRAGYNWGRLTASKPVAELVSAARSIGFAAILIDANAYEGDPWFATTTAELTRVLPAAPIVSADRRWWTFPLEGCCGSAPTTQVSGKARMPFPYDASSGPISFALGGTGVLYDAGGWQEPESWGTWSSTEARLRMRIEPTPRNGITIVLNTRMLIGPRIPRRTVTIEGNGHRLGVFSFSATNQEQQIHLRIPANSIGPDGALELHFATTPEATPSSAGINADRRPLALGLISLSIASEPQTP
jgi:phosphoglycerol transferase